MRRLRIEIPATTANLGPGFDALGMALDFTEVVEVVIGGDEVVLEGCPPGLDPHDNLFCAGYRAWEARRGRHLRGARFSPQNRIPMARGLGSSAACVLAGVAAAAWVGDDSGAEGEILELASTLEGHADNAVAAVLGGITVACCHGERVHALRVCNAPPLEVVLYVPDAELLTDEARAALPERVPLQDAVFNVGRAAYLVTALAAGRWEALGEAMEDRLHQPYRLRHIPALNEVIGAAREAGALGAALSGGGPSVLAFVPEGRSAPVARAMEEAAQRHGEAGRSMVTRVRDEGLRVREDPGDYTPI